MKLSRHILPNALSPVIVAATIGIGGAIITESALSFLGLGFPPDVPSWGRLLNDAQNFLDVEVRVMVVEARPRITVPDLQRNGLA